MLNMVFITPIGFSQPRTPAEQAANTSPVSFPDGEPSPPDREHVFVDVFNAGQQFTPMRHLAGQLLLASQWPLTTPRALLSRMLRNLTCTVLCCLFVVCCLLLFVVAVAVAVAVFSTSISFYVCSLSCFVFCLGMGNVMLRLTCFRMLRVCDPHDEATQRGYTRLKLQVRLRCLFVCLSLLC